MAFEKAIIVNTDTDEHIKVKFNPEHYSISKSNNFVEIGIPGLESPLIQFSKGKGDQGFAIISFQYFCSRYRDLDEK